MDKMKVPYTFSEMREMKSLPPEMLSHIKTKFFERFREVCKSKSAKMWKLEKNFEITTFNKSDNRKNKTVFFTVVFFVNSHRFELSANFYFDTVGDFYNYHLKVKSNIGTLPSCMGFKLRKKTSQSIVIFLEVDSCTKFSHIVSLLVKFKFKGNINEILIHYTMNKDNDVILMQSDFYGKQETIKHVDFEKENLLFDVIEEFEDHEEEFMKLGFTCKPNNFKQFNIDFFNILSYNKDKIKDQLLIADMIKY